MRIILPLLMFLMFPFVVFAEGGIARLNVESQTAADSTLVEAARERTTLDIRYDPKYVRLKYPSGDVPADTGVCTDVIIRSFRTAYEFDFQKAIHEDMKTNFIKYPNTWGLSRPDKNIDHRRVPNIERFLTRQNAELPITKEPKDYLPGDIVSWRLGGRLPHIGIVSDRKTKWGTPLIIHNIGAGPVEDDVLFGGTIHGHFRFQPNSKVEKVDTPNKLVVRPNP